MPTSTAGTSSSRGFTLLELVIVLVVIGVCLGLVLPQTGAFLYRDDFRANVRGLAVTIGHARNKAILTQTIWAVIFDMDTQAYWAAPLKYDILPDGTKVLTTGEAEERRVLGGDLTFDEITVWDKAPKDRDRIVVRAMPNGLMEPAVLILTKGAYDKRELRIKSFGGRLEYIESEEDS